MPPVQLAQPLLGDTDSWCLEARMAKAAPLGPPSVMCTQSQYGPSRTPCCPHQAQHKVHELHHYPWCMEESLIYLPPVLCPINLKWGLNADCVLCFCAACICTLRLPQHKGFPVATGEGSGYMALPKDGSKLGRGTQNAILFWELLQGAGTGTTRVKSYICVSFSLHTVINCILFPSLALGFNHFAAQTWIKKLSSFSLVTILFMLHVR